MRRRKNYLITLIFILIFWASFALMIFLVEPEMIKDALIKDSYLLFFFNLFLALFFTLGVIFTSSRRGLLGALAIILFLFLKLNGLANLFNCLIIAGLVVVVDRLFSSKT